MNPVLEFQATQLEKKYLCVAQNPNLIDATLSPLGKNQDGRHTTLHFSNKFVNEEKTLLQK